MSPVERCKQEQESCMMRQQLTGQAGRLGAVVLLLLQRGHLAVMTRVRCALLLLRSRLLPTSVTLASRLTPSAAASLSFDAIECMPCACTPTQEERTVAPRLLLRLSLAHG